jgi:peptide-methionine (S)-S-oxide reductase
MTYTPGISRQIRWIAALVVLAASGSVSTALAVPAKPQATATFAGGCFWSAESMFEGLKGVSSVVSGYAGGTVKNPTYEQVCDGTTGHAEAVQVTYDPSLISYAELTDLYWHNIDPTQVNGAFCDHGRQYRSVIFYADDAQKKVAVESKAQIEKTQPKFRGKIAVAIEPFKNFYPVEAYHQDFYKTNPEHYNAYRVGCGRDRRLKELWGAPGRMASH